MGPEQIKCQKAGNTLRAYDALRDDRMQDAVHAPTHDVDAPLALEKQVAVTASSSKIGNICGHWA